MTTIPQDVATFLDSIKTATRRADARVLVDMMMQITGLPPHKAGTMIGFDTYHYKYDSGREGDSFVTGFAPRAQKTVVYIQNGFSDYGDLLDRLGKHTTSVSCLNINKLADVDLDILKKIITASHKAMKTRYPTS